MKVHYQRLLFAQYGLIACLAYYPYSEGKMSSFWRQFSQLEVIQTELQLYYDISSTYCRAGGT